MLRHVDLCSGIGGFSLGFSWDELSKTIMFCDTEEWCRKILAKNFPNVPIAKDVKELANDPERNVPDHDILSCGYPCQPFSVAGLRKGEEDDRHIWPSIFRIITQKRPSWVVCENVYGHVALGLDKVLFDLESESYATRTFIVPACAKNAPHRRDRLWIIARNVGDTQHNGSSSTEIGRSNEENARGSQKREIQTKQLERASGRANHETMAYSKCLGWEQRSEEQGEFDREESSDQLDFGSERCTRSRSSSHVADTSSEGLQGRTIHSTISEGGSKESQLGNKSSRVYTDEGIWFAEPNICRVAHGIPKRMDRLKGLGNAIVPQLAMQIGLAIKKEIEKDGQG